MIKQLSLLPLVILYSGAVGSAQIKHPHHDKIESFLTKMTIEEKVGQLNQYSNPDILTGVQDDSKQEMRRAFFKKGMVGSVLNVLGVKNARAMQKAAINETRLGIPLLFAYDVIHGYRTTFPIPLAESASWDLEAIEKSARIAAIEASASGIHWTFAPMIDISRDPRWGRVMEGAGEDTYLNAVIAKARVKGFQGNDLSAPDTVAACAKHFAAYGEVLAGREYHTVDISERKLWETHLPPFKAAIDAGVRTFMNAFNEYDGIPASGNSYLMRDILRKHWGFKGVVVSDWGSYSGMIDFGVVSNKAGAAELALTAGSDIDMEADVYSTQLPALVKNGEIDENLLDEAVRRVLTLKADLGLLDDPYRYLDEDREKNLIRHPDHIAAARDIARKSIVLLKNDPIKNGNKLLPLSPDLKFIAVIGPLADNQEHMNGFWKAQGQSKEVVTLLQGIKNRVSLQTKVRFSEGSNLESSNRKKLKHAIKIAKKSDVVVLAVGENSKKTGEAASRLSIGLYEAQIELIKALHATGKPIVLVLMNGRPLSTPWSSGNIPAIINGWFLGNEAGHALADVLFGDYNPSGKLTMTVPAHLGQVPIFYNQKRGNRTYTPNTRYTTKYIDGPNEPLYPFGFGLSYTDFEYTNLTLNKQKIKPGETITATVTLKNVGSRDGHEIVQMYIQDLVGSVIRPIKELKGFEKIFLKAGESKYVQFKVSLEDLTFYTRNKTYSAEAGEFKILIGGSSTHLISDTFTLM